MGILAGTIASKDCVTGREDGPLGAGLVPWQFSFFFLFGVQLFAQRVLTLLGLQLHSKAGKYQ
jgi:hypothetical protein